MLANQARDDKPSVLGNCACLPAPGLTTLSSVWLYIPSLIVQIEDAVLSFRVGLHRRV
jgi:hypothetical protein